MALNLTQNTSFSSLYQELMGITTQNVVSDDSRCDNCGEYLCETDGIARCTNCGVHLGSMISHSAEWRNDSGGEDKNRAGMPINRLLPETSYAIGISMVGCNKNVYHDIKKTLIWSQPYQERSLKQKFDNISLKCKSSGITDALIEFTQTIYNDVKEKLEENTKHKQKRGDNDQGLQAASLFYAFQEDGHPKTYKEIAKVFEIEPDYVSEGIKLFKELMVNSTYQIKTNKYSDYINGYCNSLDLNKEIKQRIIQVADKANELGILDRNVPTAIVAGCIYYVIIENGISSISKNIISHYCNISIPTITKVCDKLCMHTLELSI